ncbi:hypothetical protein EON64_16550 [archaeon]|nr:MAG: hypothetical protein EON64_16550 [archaeon]
MPPLDTWGQPGHLTEAQQEALQSFLTQASSADLDLAKFRIESQESVGLRFLRARSFNVANALTLLADCVKKKTDCQARKWATCTPDECAECDVEALKIWYPHAILGFDRHNRPLFLELSGRAEANAIRQMTTMERLVNYHWFTMENVLNGLVSRG